MFRWISEPFFFLSLVLIIVCFVIFVIVIFITVILIVIGIVFIILGNRQSKSAEDVNIDKIPLTRPTTKIMIGGVLIIVGSIQLFPLIK